LGVIRSTNHALVDQHLLTIGRIRKFFAFYFRLFNGCSAKQTRTHKVGIKPKWTRRQTETNHLKAVLFWLQEYWTG
jgi:hypothetical protein